MEIKSCLKSEFMLPDDVSYINCAYMSPLPKKVVEAGKIAVENKAFPFRIKPIDFFETTEELRREFAKIIKASTEDIALVPSASYGIASVARNISLQPGDEILVVSEQFPSNIYSWKRLASEQNAKVVYVDPPDNLSNRGKTWNQNILDHITDKTRVIAMGIVHWSDGTLFDLKSIRSKADAKNALLILDGTQSIGAMPFDVNEIKPDALVVAGYKWLMCPYTISFAWLGERFKSGVPLEENWINRKESENFAGLVNYQDEFSPGARRFDMGEKSNFILNPMGLVALKQVNEWGPENIQGYCRELVAGPVAKMKEMGFWIEDEAYRGAHLFGIRLPKNINLENVKKKCETMNVFVSIRGSAIRISPNVYNNFNDFNKLIEALS